MVSHQPADMNRTVTWPSSVATVTFPSLPSERIPDLGNNVRISVRSAPIEIRSKRLSLESGGRVRKVNELSPMGTYPSAAHCPPLGKMRLKKSSYLRTSETNRST